MSAGLEHPWWPVREVELPVVRADEFLGAQDAVSAADDEHVTTLDRVGEGRVRVLVEGAAVTALVNYASGGGVLSARMRTSVRMISATVSQCSSASRTPTLGDFVLTCLLVPAIC